MSNKPKACARALAGGFFLCATMAATSGAAQDERAVLAPDRAPVIALAVATRPHLVAGVLYWSDHRLAAICGAFDGHFAKLPGSVVYRCEPASAGSGMHVGSTSDAVTAREET